MGRFIFCACAVECLFLSTLLPVVFGFVRNVGLPLQRTRESYLSSSFLRPFATTTGENQDEFRDGENSRRQLFKHAATVGMGLLAGSLNSEEALAAPPIAIIAEELGYFPVTNSANETVYIPKRIKRQSSDQAIQLARKLRESGAVMYTAFWCPHCARQRELWGREAFAELRNVECAPKGYNAQPGICFAKQVDGYPTLILGNGKVISGERDLADLAKEIGFKGFQEKLETNIPPPLGSSACKQ